MSHHRPALQTSTSLCPRPRSRHAARSTHGEFVDAKARHPSPGPGGLAAYDPDGFKLLSSLYSGTHPSLEGTDPIGRRLRPLTLASDGKPPPTADTDDGSEAAQVGVEFDNRGGECSWDLYWLPADGPRVQYGVIAADATLVQQTYVGHVWVLEATPTPPTPTPPTAKAEAASGRVSAGGAGGAGAGRQRLCYAAESSPSADCVAVIAEDAVEAATRAVSRVAVYVGPAAAAAA